MDGTRRDLALAEKELCTIRAPKNGMVIYPSARSWEKTPDVEEGATVHRDQTLLLMPDLKHMQVKVGIHESMIERVKLGLRAVITLPEQQLVGEISEVAAVAEPASWWTGNLVKYDTIVELPELKGLRPGMSAEVELYLAEYENVIVVPVTAVLDSVQGTLCWVRLASGKVERRTLVLGDSNDVMIIVESGLAEGDDVVLNPRGAVQEAREISLRPSPEEGDGTEVVESQKGAEVASTQAESQKGDTQAPPVAVEASSR
jgi:multidrug efflux pump subunit AcrA (membrane-fusion protein)